MSKFDSLVAGLMEDTGLTPKGSLESPLDITLDGMTVTVASETHFEVEDIVLHARLGAVRPERELEMYRLILDANVLWASTAFATLGVNSATREVVICYRTPAEPLTGESFAELLSGFIDIANDWRQVVAQQDDLGSRPMSSESDPLAGMIRV